MHRTLEELAELIGGDPEGDLGLKIYGAADLTEAEEGDVVFAESDKLFDTACASTASAIIARRGMKCPAKAVIAVDDPRYAFAKALEVFSPARHRELGVHPSACIGEGAKIGENPSIGYNVHIGRGAKIGRNVWIYPSVYLGDNVVIGDDCVLHPFVSIYYGVTLGNRVIVHSGSVIGADGFGYTPVGGAHYKIPQIGVVKIGDNVEIGANCTIDRARTGRTVIGQGTKVDNLVHIAHNVTVGENCVVIAQVGVSGSVAIGDRAILAGQAGVKDHVTIGPDTIVCGKAGVIGDIEPGSFVSGYPARPHKEQMRVQAAQMRLPQLLRTVKELEKRLKDLEEGAK
ncbi:MAG: UDP-3-O-(3-hydroxymyristoyl)glucosamine N-acyltransferase [Armatimonadota bacterium]